MRVKGSGGRLLAGGRPVAQVHAWELEDAVGGYLATAQLSVVDAFYLDQLTTFDVELMLGGRRLFWRRLPVTVSGVVATFGIDRIREDK
jgi:hypothetical protein